MGPVRRTISLIRAIALMAVGAVALIFLLFYAQHIRGWMLMAAGLVLTTGAMWLYSDFINATPNE